MPNLKCHEYSCKYNNCTHCLVGTLSVTIDALCADYKRRRADESANFDYEFANDRGISLKQDEHRILCNALACYNNAGGECYASYIRIDRKNDKAYCCQVRKR